MKRKLGANGPEITTVGFGAFAIGGPWEWGWGEVDDDESVRTIRHAIERGINWIDTAPLYGFGHSEEIVAKALEPYRIGEDVHVFTKCGRNWYGRPPGVIENDLRPASIRQECEHSLRRLGIDRIDLFQFHWPDWTTGTLLEESWGTMVELVAEGKARWIGVCNFDCDQLDRCEAIRHVDSLQPPLSFLERGTRQTVISWAAEHGTGVIAYRPMAGGMLTGAFDLHRMERLDADDWRHRSPMFTEPEFSRNVALVDRLRPISGRLNVSLPALVVAWVLAQRGVTGAIVGGRRPEQIDDWLPATDLSLDEATLAEIDSVIAGSGAGTDEPPTPPARMLAQVMTGGDDVEVDQ